jgi:nitrogen PTS system EIIA component
MELKVKDIAALLQTSEEAVRRMAAARKLPAYKIGSEYRFNRSEVHEWVMKNRVQDSGRMLDLGDRREDLSLAELIRRGGVLENVGGNSSVEVIREAIGRISAPADVDKETLLYFLIQREELMPTAIGRGVAVPHPRNPVIAAAEHESVTICFLRHAVDFSAMDGRPVHTLFIILSANPRRHLEILARIAFLCQDDLFIDMLETRAPAAGILTHIERRECEWRQRKPSGHE